MERARAELLVIWRNQLSPTNLGRIELPIGYTYYSTKTLHIVGIPGFEPGTPCSQSRCATGLRYIPKKLAGGGGFEPTIRRAKICGPTVRRSPNLFPITAFCFHFWHFVSIFGILISNNGIFFPITS